MGTLHGQVHMFDHISLNYFWMRNFSEKKVVEKTKIHVSYSVTFSENRAVLWDNMEKYGTAGQATDDNITEVCALRAG